MTVRPTLALSFTVFIVAGFWASPGACRTDRPALRRQLPWRNLAALARRKETFDVHLRLDGLKIRFPYLNTFHSPLNVRERKVAARLVTGCIRQVTGATVTPTELGSFYIKTTRDRAPVLLATLARRGLLDRGRIFDLNSHYAGMIETAKETGSVVLHIGTSILVGYALGAALGPALGAAGELAGDAAGVLGSSAGDAAAVAVPFVLGETVSLVGADKLTSVILPDSLEARSNRHRGAHRVVHALRKASRFIDVGHRLWRTVGD